MRFIKDLKDGDRVGDIYLCKHKQSALTKNGKPYENVILQDRTGTMEAKIWDPNSPGISEFDVFDYIDVSGEVTTFQNMLQVNVKRLRVCSPDEYHPADYLPVSAKGVEGMYQELLSIVASITNPYCKKLLESLFVEDEIFRKAFCQSSAAKSIHHGFVGGLLEHTLNVTKLCNYYCTQYPILKRDLLLTAALCHDMGKVRELSPFPENAYTDDGQLLGHIVMGAQMVWEKASGIPDFPHALLSQLQHCVLAHQGKLEYGSPKTPQLVEAVALYYADDTDAKMETMKEIFDQQKDVGRWTPYNRLFESCLRVSSFE
jgi:3'-5' exoribonuclease